MNSRVYQFSSWVRWDKRLLLPNLEFPGVYVIGRFKSAPSGPARPASREIIYIGETTKQTLEERLCDFDRSAFKGNTDRHSGGKTYVDIFGAKRSRTLYVAVFAESKKTDPVRSLFIQFIEIKLLLGYAEKWGRRPACNKK